MTSTTYQRNNPKSIQTLFKTIAPKYDKGNALLSFNLHKRWNAQLVDSVLSSTTKEPLLDLCAGTGAITEMYLKQKRSPSHVILLDFCQEMLDQAQEKLKPFSEKNHLVDYICADAEHIPLKDGSVGIITMAYGIRNIKNRDNALKEAFRTLKEGGSLSILELTRPNHPFLLKGHTFYLNYLVPLLGKFVTKNKAAYQYLCDSVSCFTPKEILEQEIRNAGFKRVKITSLSGGIATILTAKKF